MAVHRSYRAFSLVELVMVVATIGIVAAIAAPRMSSAATSANTTAVLANIRILDNAAEVYAAEHNGVSIGLEFDGVTPVDGAMLILRLTSTTDEDGKAGGWFGPYLHTIPRNPGNGLRTVRINGDPAGSDLYGWRFDTGTGRFEPDDAVHAVAMKVLAQQQAGGGGKPPLGAEGEPEVIKK
ncbi:MAG: type II secretion system protein [Phycisphaerales bacterium]